jgi:hypothetical protein
MVTRTVIVPPDVVLVPLLQILNVMLDCSPTTRFVVGVNEVMIKSGAT